MPIVFQKTLEAVHRDRRAAESRARVAESRAKKAEAETRKANEAASDAAKAATRAADAAASSAAAQHSSRISSMQDDFNRKMDQQARDNRNVIERIRNQNAEAQKEALAAHARAHEIALNDQKAKLIKEAEKRKAAAEKEMKTFKV